MVPPGWVTKFGQMTLLAKVPVWKSNGQDIRFGGQIAL
jgi:hypothetical protein